jgi:hypothetical protein
LVCASTWFVLWAEAEERRKLERGGLSSALAPGPHLEVARASCCQKKRWRRRDLLYSFVGIYDVSPYLNRAGAENSNLKVEYDTNKIWYPNL